MSAHVILVEPTLAQVAARPSVSAESGNSLQMGVSGALLFSLIGSWIFFHVKIGQLSKKLKTEEFKNRELQKKYKTSVGTITKMEKNPDLIHSREFNLDYLRMRMEEETFHFAVVNQIKVKVKNKITLALRPNPENRGAGRLVDEIFDVEYEMSAGGVTKKRVLFRIQIKLTKLPTQPTSATISQIIDCIETYLSPAGGNDTWQPSIQGRVAYIHWDQHAKPTPLLVLEQTNEGVNVTFRTRRATPAVEASAAPAPAAPARASARPAQVSVGKRPTSFIR